MIVVHKLADERRKLKVTQAELANYLKVNQRAVSNWECGLRGLTINHLFGYVNFLRSKGSDISIETLFYTTNDTPN